MAIGISHEINNPLAVILNQAELLEHDVARLAGEGECAVEVERVDAIRREIARISEILERLTEMAQGDTYETIGYIGPARMVDLRKKHARAADDERLRGARILVVDDDGGIRRSLTEILELDGCCVDSASDGEDALAKLTEGALRRGALRRRDAEDGRLRPLHLDPRALAGPARADDDRVPLRQGPHHQAQPRSRASRA